MRKHFEAFVVTPASIMWHDWRARLGAVIVLGYILVGVVGPFVIEPASTGDGPPLQAPFQTLDQPLGTDRSGQDLLALTVHSTVPILKMVTAGGLFTVTVGTVFGLVAGYKGGLTDTVLSTIMDIFINIPGLPLVVVLATLFQPSNSFLIGVLLVIASWAGLARAIRSQVLSIRNESFVEASRMMGMPTSKILSRDLLPHLLPYISVNLVKAARSVIFSAVGLYFIGVLPITDSNWGVMLSNAYNGGAMYRIRAVHWLLVPLVAIIGLSMGLILLAQSLDRVFNPRVRAKHAESSELEDIESDTDVSPPETIH